MEQKEVKPKYAQLPVYHPLLRTFLAVGTFAESQVNEQRVVARILSHREDSQGVSLLMLQLFPRVGKSHHDSTIPYKQVFYSHQTVEVPVASVVEICWVFSVMEADDLHNTLGHGSHYIYVVTSFDSGHAFPQQEHDEESLLLPFPDQSKDYPLRDRSYSLTIFSDLQRIVDEADKILNRSADVNRGSGSTFIHEVTLDFFDRHKHQKPYFISRTIFRKRTDSGVITRVRRKKNLWKVYRFQTDEELQKLFSMFGPTIVVGNRTRRPPIDHPFVPSTGTTQRVVVPSQADEKFDRHSGRSGVDLATDGCCLRLYIRYREANIARDNGHGKNDTTFLEKTYIHQLVLDVPSDEDDDDESIDDRLT